MKVEVKDIYTNMELKNRGMELCVRDSSGKQIADLYVSSKGLIWCEGKTARENGEEATWAEFRTWMLGK